MHHTPPVMFTCCTVCTGAAPAVQRYVPRSVHRHHIILLPTDTSHKKFFLSVCGPAVVVGGACGGGTWSIEWCTSSQIGTLNIVVHE
jgi:hypothetical protein